MRYLLFVCTDPAAEPYDPAQDNVEEWVSHYQNRGIRIVGHRMADVDQAVTVCVRKGQRLITDGPFAETKEWIAGFDLLECGVSIRPSRSRRGIPWPDSAASRSGPSGPWTETGWNGRSCAFE